MAHANQAVPRKATPYWVKSSALFAGLACLFFLLQHGWLLSSPPGGGPPWIYAATGLLVGCLHLARERFWPFVLAAYGVAGLVVWWWFRDGAAILDGDAAAAFDLVPILIDIAEALIVVYVLKRMIGDGDPFGELATALVLTATIAATMSLGLFASLLAAFKAGPGAMGFDLFLSEWADWGRAHALGLLLVGGFFLSWFGLRPLWLVRSLRQHFWEVVIAGLLFACAIWFVFASRSPYLSGAVAFAGPIIIWLTIRFSVEGGLLAVLILAQSLLTSAAVHAGSWYGPVELDERRLFQVTVAGLVVGVFLIGAKKRGEFRKALRKRDRRRLMRSEGR